jgi:hypothetical protein
MVIRLAELQVALPKTQDVSKIVEQLQQRGQSMQDYIALDVQKKEEQKRRQVTKNGKKEGPALHLQSSSHNEKLLINKGKKNEHKKQHPFKGNHIDISG